jgi:hypothetical protein
VKRKGSGGENRAKKMRAKDIIKQFAVLLFISLYGSEMMK